jgi:hypothetical protein
VTFCTDILECKSVAWPEMEDIKRSGVRAQVFLIIQRTIQISGTVWQIQNGCLFLLVLLSEFYRVLNNLSKADL